MHALAVGRIGIQEYYSHLFLTGSKKHTTAFDTAKLCGCKVGNDHDLLPYQLLGRIELSNSRYDLALFITEIHLQLQKLFGAIPVKSVTVAKLEDIKVYVGGAPFGIKFSLSIKKYK